ncbi:MAG: polyisoprenoid-binding protein [Flavobacteriaceae bacterium]|nr:MAG: polyisoprenoid-binding protein [Flavobacteriaceae bacterium]
MDSTIKKLGLAVALTLFIAVSVHAQDVTVWKVDKAHTSVNFSVNHFFSAVTGKFTIFNGNFNFDTNNLKESNVDFTVSIKSVNTDNAKRDKHLQSGDFFDANTYPNLVFKSFKIEMKSDNEYLIHGKLTIKDKTKEVILPMKITGKMVHPMKKNTLLMGIVINTTINRTDFGIGTGDWATTMVVGNEVRIHIPMELNSKK